MDKFDEIRKYKELLDEGIISQTEFDDYKSSILSTSIHPQTDEVFEANDAEVVTNNVIELSSSEVEQAHDTISPVYPNNFSAGLRCPSCGTTDVNVQVVTEQKLVKKHHSIIYWLFIGWWFNLIVFVAYSAQSAR